MSQQSIQLSQRLRGPGLDRSFRNAQNVGDLMKFEVLIMAQRDDLPIVWCQAEQCLAHLLRQFLAFDLSVGRRLIGARAMQRDLVFVQLVERTFTASL